MHYETFNRRQRLSLKYRLKDFFSDWSPISYFVCVLILVTVSYLVFSGIDYTFGTTISGSARVAEKVYTPGYMNTRANTWVSESYYVIVFIGDEVVKAKCTVEEFAKLNKGDIVLVFYVKGLTGHHWRAHVVKK